MKRNKAQIIEVCVVLSLVLFGILGAFFWLILIFVL
jgi:hypothetical protein